MLEFECSSAHITYKWPFSSMDHHMITQITTISKPLATTRTFIFQLDHLSSTCDRYIIWNAVNVHVRSCYFSSVGTYLSSTDISSVGYCLFSIGTYLSSVL
ncbi:unnamed protein product [Owenia fusiformis]|uniref:Uncharacterized protein n=1 Tax=Owenia fusiformis TaxID=6347 RepID=A0A8S4N921_OWEFU|nr:unnamed protein product [Owenia fusiformis]